MGSLTRYAVGAEIHMRLSHWACAVRYADGYTVALLQVRVCSATEFRHSSVLRGLGCSILLLRVSSELAEVGWAWARRDHVREEMRVRVCVSYLNCAMWTDADANDAAVSKLRVCSAMQFLYS
jgi:hypothetical protein